MKFRVLGPLELLDRDRRVGLPAGKRQAVLALLLLDANRPVSQDRLIEAMWNGAPPPSAVATLHSHVYRLRKTLDNASEPGAASLRRTRRGYVLEVAEDDIDEHEFSKATADANQALEKSDFEAALETLRTGLALWRGDAYAGIDVSVVREHAAILDDQRLAALESYLTAWLELSDHHAALAELETATAQYPFRERFWELLMIAYVRSGRQAEALEAYRQLYRLLDDELGIQPGPSVQELHRRILAGSPELEARPKSRASIALPVPRLLPLGVRGFTGRVQQLKALDALLPDDRDPSSAKAAIAVISGTAGVGKTALAVRWAHLVADRFPDGQLYVNLRGYDAKEQPLTSAEAIGGLLHALGVEPQGVPPDLDGRVRLYRSRLVGRRMLVVLDNASGEEQVRPLLPATGGCVVVVTSRDQLAGLVAVEAAALALPLDLLTDTEARELLVRRLGHERVATEIRAADSIIESCARLPLALAVAAAQAAVRPSLALDVLASQLRHSYDSLEPFTGHDQSTDVRTVFSWSYRQLTPPAARLFQLFGLHPGPDVSAPAMASLAGVPVGQAQALLDELSRAHLLAEPHTGRFTTHDLLRAYAAELAASTSLPEQQLAINRLLDHYLHTAHAAAVLISPVRQRLDLTPQQAGVRPEPLTDQKHAAEWLTAERQVLLAALHYAARHGFDAHAWQLAAALGDYLGRKGHWYEQTAAFETALESARRLDDPAALALVHRSLAASYILHGRGEDAHAHLRRALTLSRQRGDDDDLGETYRYIGMVLMRQGRHAETLPHSQSALRHYRAAGNKVGQARSLSALGWCYTQLDQHEQAVRYCRQALPLLQDLGDHAGVAHTWDSLGHALHHTGDHRQAIDAFRRSIRLHSQAGERYYLAITLTHLAEAQHSIGDQNAALDSWRQALSILDDLGHPTADQVRTELKKRARELPDRKGA